MRIGTSRARGAMRTVVRRRSSPVDIERPTNEGQSGRFGESEDGGTTTVSGVQMWVHEPRETNIDTQYGDRLDGDLQGIALPSADVQVHDRISHGGDEFEVDRIMHVPDNDDTVLKLFSLQRRTNDN